MMLALGAPSAQAQMRSNVVPGSPPPPKYEIPGWISSTINQIINTPAPLSDENSGDTLNNIVQWLTGGNYQYTSQYGGIVPAGSIGGETPDLSGNSSGNSSGPMGMLGGPFNLSMYSAGFGGFNASSTYSTGYRLSDTAGSLAPNALSPGYRSFESGGGLHLTVDASRLFDLPTNQNLWFGLTGNYNGDDVRYQASTLTPGGSNANAASENTQTYSLTGSVNYRLNTFYVSGQTLFDRNHADITNNFFIPGAQGATNGSGYALKATVGNVFPLVNTTGLSPATIAKAPPSSAGGYALLLDASGHYLYRDEHEDGFTDSTGFAYGAQQYSYNDLGASAKLLAVVPDRGFAWMPYLGATVDQQLGLRDTFDIPAQAVTAADTLIFSPSTTWWGGEAGLNLLTAHGIKFGMKAFYQASADTQTVGGNAFLRIPFEDFAPAADSGIRIAPIGLPVKAPPAPAPATWSWAGLYIGGHVGGALNIAKFSDPFGTPIFGDIVRSPGFLGGGQIGYNWQAPGSRWVFGLEADASVMDSDGDATCFAVSSAIIPSTCRVRPQATGTLTGRIGYALGPAGRTLIYAKGGLAWANDTIDMTLDTGAAGAPSNSQSVNFWGGTVGLGVEHALTPAWSLKAEYDYVGFGSSNVANVGAETVMPVAPYTVTAIPSSTSGVSQSFQEVKLGLNYKWGADPWAPAWNSGPLVFPAKSAAPFSAAGGWEVEGGVRYVGNWGQFHKDFGAPISVGAPAMSDYSRLDYEDLQTYSGEFFGRIETPSNLFVKGFIGSGSTNTGHEDDEDFFCNCAPNFPTAVSGYQNTLEPAVTGGISYGAIDAGYDVLRGPGYKVGAFAGYFHLNESMNAFGCTAVAFINCTPNPVPTSGSPVITESDKWDAVRAGVAAETMLTDHIKISADVAYLPWVGFSDLDQHFVANTGVLHEIFQGSGKGAGVQADTAVSYFITPQWSIGIGGRYWGMWTNPTGQNYYNCGAAGCSPTPEDFKAQLEQLGAFVQTSYKFNWGG